MDFMNVETLTHNAISALVIITIILSMKLVYTERYMELKDTSGEVFYWVYQLCCMFIIFSILLDNYENYITSISVTDFYKLLLALLLVSAPIVYLYYTRKS